MQIFLVPLLKKNYLFFNEFYKLRTVGRKKGKLEIQLKHKRDQSSLSGSCSYFSFQYIDLQVQEPFFIFAEERIFFCSNSFGKKTRISGSKGYLSRITWFATKQIGQTTVQTKRSSKQEIDFCENFKRGWKEAIYLLSLNYWYS